MMVEQRINAEESMRVLPEFNEGGNLVFCFVADEDKLVSILQNGIRPRGGRPEPGSYFPQVVSLAAIRRNIFDGDNGNNVATS
ncbi:MAG: hypothetical protein Q8R11_01115 [bacterium]|nr:hypothetical protein [bacterium]